MSRDAAGQATTILSAAFDAVERGDIDAFEALLADGATIWHNYDQKTMRLSETAAGLRAMTGAVASVRYTDRRYVAVPGGAFAEHVLRVTTAAGRGVEVPIAAHIHLEAGKIKHIDEYLDPSQSAVIVNAIQDAG